MTETLDWTNFGKAATAGAGFRTRHNVKVGENFGRIVRHIADDWKDAGQLLKKDVREIGEGIVYGASRGEAVPASLQPAGQPVNVQQAPPTTSPGVQAVSGYPSAEPAPVPMTRAQQLRQAVASQQQVPAIQQQAQPPMTQQQMEFSAHQCAAPPMRPAFHINWWLVAGIAAFAVLVVMALRYKQGQKKQESEAGLLVFKSPNR